MTMVLQTQCRAEALREVACGGADGMGQTRGRQAPVRLHGTGLLGFGPVGDQASEAADFIRSISATASSRLLNRLGSKFSLLALDSMVWPTSSRTA